MRRPEAAQAAPRRGVVFVRRQQRVRVQVPSRRGRRERRAARASARRGAPGLQRPLSARRGEDHLLQHAPGRHRPAAPAAGGGGRASSSGADERVGEAEPPRSVPDAKRARLTRRAAPACCDTGAESRAARGPPFWCLPARGARLALRARAQMQRLRACGARALRLASAERRPDGSAAAARLVLTTRAGFHASCGAADGGAAKGAAAAGERCARNSWRRAAALCGRRRRARFLCARPARRGATLTLPAAAAARPQHQRDVCGPRRRAHRVPRADRAEPAGGGALQQRGPGGAARRARVALRPRALRSSRAAARRARARGRWRAAPATS